MSCEGKRMAWLTITLIGSAFLGLIHISDKVVLRRYIRTPLTLILLIGVVDGIVGVFLLGFSRIPSEATLFNNLAAISSGAFIGFAIILLQRVLYTEEVSRVVPITQSAPIFTALLALLILGESISLIQWLGIVTAVTGSVLISLKIDSYTRKIFLRKSFYSLMFSAMLFGAAGVAGKIAVEEMPVVYTQGLRNIAFGLVLVFFAFRTEVITDVKNMIRERSPGLTLVIINQGITAQIGSIMLLWGLSLGPASLVTTVGGSRVLFALIYSIGLSKVWDGLLGEDTSSQSILLKVSSTVLVVAGIAVISI